MDVYLKYVGQASLVGVPARDLTRDEAVQHGEQRLLDSGLYVRADSGFHHAVKQSRGASQNKALPGGSENKEE